MYNKELGGIFSTFSIILSSCFLNPDTKFIWAFIVPVVVIILINIGFFIMAATIMWRHQKKEIDKTKIQNIRYVQLKIPLGDDNNNWCIRNWFKSAVSLVVIMGLTWIFGVLVVEVEALLPLTYIYTIMVAFQGLFIFILFVPTSKNVREAYSKWWKEKVNESDILSKYFGENISSKNVSIL